MNTLNNMLEDLNRYSSKSFSSSVQERLNKNLNRYIESLEKSANKILSKKSKISIIKELSK